MDMNSASLGHCGSQAPIVAFPDDDTEIWRALTRTSWVPDRGRIGFLGKIGGYRAGHALLVAGKIGHEQVPADAGRHQRDVAPHAGNVADRQAETDESGRIVNMDVAQVRRLTGDFLQVFVRLSQVRMAAEEG